MSFSGLLCLLFIGLKLGGVITWSWVWVLAPLWGVVAFAVLYALLVATARLPVTRKVRRR